MARKFVNASSQVIDLGTFRGALEIYGPITLAAWIRPTTLPNVADPYRSIIAAGYDSTSAGYDIRLDFGSLSADSIWFGTYNAGAGGEHGVHFAVTIPTTRWTHLCGVFDGAAWKAYINGYFKAQSIDSFPPAANNPAFHYLLGGLDLDGPFTRFFDGLIAEAAIWNVGLTSGEVVALGQGANPMRIRRPVLYVPLRDDGRDLASGLVYRLGGTAAADHPPLPTPPLGSKL